MKKIKWTLSSLVLIAFAVIFWASGTPQPVQQPAKVLTDLSPGVTPDAKELTRITEDKLQEFSPHVSPDGTRLLYEIVDPTKDASSQYVIMLKVLGTPGVTPLLSEGCRSPSWMNDSRGFYFSYTKPGKPVIAKSKIDQMGISYVSANANGGYDYNPYLFTAQNKVLFTTSIGEANQICTIEQNGLNFTLLTEGYDPFPHPKKNLFVFTKKIGVATQIFLYDFTTSQQTQITNSSDFSSANASISPDGKWIAFQRYKIADKSTNYEKTSSHIFIMNLEGGNLRQLTTGKTWNSQPCFGSDGFIYFASNAGNSDKYRRYDNYDIWRVRPNLSE
jgi:TolB protein